LKKQVHLLRPHHHAHLSSLGIPWHRAPHLRCDEAEYRHFYDHWKNTLPDADHELLHTKALGHIAWQQHHSKPTRAKGDHRWELRILAALILILIFLVLVPHAHCQFSKVNSIEFQQAGVSISGAYFTYPFRINCSTNMTCTVSGNTLTMVAATTGGAGTPGGSDTQCQFNDGGAFGGIPSCTYIKATPVMKIQAGTKFLFTDTADTTKAAQLDLSNIATGTTRTVNIPNANSTTAQALASVAHKFFTTMSSQGVFTAAQPVCADLSDAGVFCSGTAYGSLTGVPATFAPTAHNLLSASHGDTTPGSVAVGDIISGQAGPVWARLAANSTATKKYLQSVSTGAPSWQQIAYADVSGTPTLAQTLANATHKWFNSYDSATGLFTQTQPDYSDLTGTPTLRYQTVQDEGVDLTQRAKVNFVGTGVTCADNAGTSVTDCTISAGGGSGASTADTFITVAHDAI
jgi:hypothetical protein